MKILVSAFACNPYQGSEPGVGWAAVKCIANIHDVYLLTDSHNRQGLEKAKLEGLVPHNVQIRIIRKDTDYVNNRFIARIQSWLWYRKFSSLVLEAAIEWHKQENFDLCHQVTIATWRIASPLWKLPIPFIWGPIGGAGHIPAEFRSMLSPLARIFEVARDIQTWMARRSRNVRACIKESSVILAANHETMELLSPYRNSNPIKWLPIASISESKVSKFRRSQSKLQACAPIRLFAGGNIVGSKGVSLALRALAIANRKGTDFHYTIAGGGPEFTALQQLSKKLGIYSKVTFHPGFRGDGYINALHGSDVYFLPSFRESTPVTLIEAYLAGCYPVVADVGAQGEIVRMAGGGSVAADSVDALVNGLAEVIVWCSENRNLLATRSRDALEKIVERFSASNYAHTLEKAYNMAIQNYNQMTPSKRP